MSARGRILFVDDDPRILEELRRQAPALGPDWEAAFADSAAKALRACAEQAFDAVAADLRMPGMGGAECLQEIMARHPATLRLLLAVLDDRNEALQGLARAHQFLAKPCDFTFLKSLLDFTRQHGRRVGNDHVRELAARIGQLPAVPELYRDITALMESDRGSAEQMGAVIGRDIAMTAMILKLANSAFFSLRHQVTSPAEAVSYLGVDLLRALVLAHGLFGQVGAFRVPGFTLHHLWQHSLEVAAAARRLAAAEGLPQLANAFFTAGLLHDIGILILASRFPEDYAKVLELNHRSGGSLEASEFHVFGASHGEVGAYLLSLWGIPEAVVAAAACHHGIARQPEPGFTPALAVHVADTHCGYASDHEVFTAARLDEGYLASLGLAGRIPVWKAAMGGGHPAV